MTLDRRRHPFREDLAAAYLRGQVDAPRFVDPVPYVVTVGRAGLRSAPDAARPLDTEVLFGEGFDVYDLTADGWAWGRCATDGYVGWVPAQALKPGTAVATRRLTARYSFLFPAPDIKAPVLDTLPMGARLDAVGVQGRFLELADGAGFVFADHAAPVEAPPCFTDPVAVAESLIGVPYLWGGRTPLGIDCSGLVQLCLAAVGIAAPRDSDMQRHELGERVGPEERPRRGDIACFPGHVAFMRDETHVAHATAFTLSVGVEPLADVARRADPTRDSGLIEFRRIGL